MAFPAVTPVYKNNPGYAMMTFNDEGSIADIMTYHFQLYWYQMFQTTKWKEIDWQNKY